MGWPWRGIATHRDLLRGRPCSLHCGGLTSQGVGAERGEGRPGCWGESLSPGGWVWC